MAIAIDFNTSSMSDYRKFLRMKRLPQYDVRGSRAFIPEEYAAMLGETVAERSELPYQPSEFLMDYQRDIAKYAVRKRKYAVFMEPGRGKTLIDFEFAHHAMADTGKSGLIVCPLMLLDQMMDEHQKFYGERFRIEQVKARNLEQWTKCDRAEPCIGITNYDAINERIQQGNIGWMILVESSMLKSAYGKWGNELIRIGAGLKWKLCETGTPAPNDRIEYANHAVFLDQFRSPNEFYAKYFVNRGQTDNRWEIKPHALRPFYRDMSHWCIFVSDPSIYGWKDGAGSIPPMHVHIEHIELSDDQRKAVQKVTGGLFATSAGGITQRARMSRIGKGQHEGQAIEAAKPQWIIDRCREWTAEGRSTIVWCKYNPEQDALESMLGDDAVSIQGTTGYDDRRQMIADFKSGRKRVLISKPKILGFGLNLQVATRQVFSTLQDSYEEYYQAIKRSNRIGSTEELHVYLPVTEIEAPMIETVLRKADRVQQDTDEQERLFKECGYVVG